MKKSYTGGSIQNRGNGKDSSEWKRVKNKALIPFFTLKKHVGGYTG